jgi:hypothetical protein
MLLGCRVAIEGLALIEVLPLIASDLSEGKLTTVLEQWAPPPVTEFFLITLAAVRYDQRSRPW